MQTVWVSCVQKVQSSHSLQTWQRNRKILTIIRAIVGDAVASGWRGPGLSPGRVIVLCSWARHFTLIVPLSTQEYKWVPANCQGNLTKCWGVTCDGLASHPGGVAILLVASCYKTEISSEKSFPELSKTSLAFSLT